jgi:hypothetical protein
MRLVLSWIAGWLSAAIAVGTGLVTWTLIRGGTVHRTPVCAGHEDANIYALGIEASGVALILALLYWSLGAESVRWRWVRLAGTVIAAIPISLGIFIGSMMFSEMCMLRFESESLHGVRTPPPRGQARSR